MSASLAPECNEVKEYALSVCRQIRRIANTINKRRYDTCFLKWYSENSIYVEYIRGTATKDECEPLFQQYKTCLSKETDSRTQKALKDRGIDQMLEDARVDNKENDIEYMKPNGR
ncbi:hypothetical protein D0863_01773 [Hortaea werneckii]|uniref:Mitochondrial distribution and morphology protein 35 n=1 Tax=Hortaea werneckii TaxID=91943 RepID=A0A3M7EJN8_HORWE|nr:hypothetical protein D0863_01773 [Hortaea werneckii]